MIPLQVRLAFRQDRTDADMHNLGVWPRVVTIGLFRAHQSANVSVTDRPS